MPSGAAGGDDSSLWGCSVGCAADDPSSLMALRITVISRKCLPRRSNGSLADKAGPVVQVQLK